MRSASVNTLTRIAAIATHEWHRDDRPVDAVHAFVSLQTDVFPSDPCPGDAVTRHCHSIAVVEMPQENSRPRQVHALRYRRSPSRTQLTRRLSGIPWQNNGNCHVDESAFEQVLKWVEHYGGYVNPNLTMGYSMTTGTR